MRAVGESRLLRAGWGHRIDELAMLLTAVAANLRVFEGP